MAEAKEVALAEAEAVRPLLEEIAVETLKNLARAGTISFGGMKRDVARVAAEAAELGVHYALVFAGQPQPMRPRPLRSIDFGAFGVRARIEVYLAVGM